MTTYISENQAQINRASHAIGIVDDCYRCVRCEIGVWNAWRQPCS